MGILINSVVTVADAASEPVSRTDAKNWMRIEDYTTDDTMIDQLITAARQHIEKLTSKSLANKQLKAIVECYGTTPPVWIVDLPYGPLVCVTEVKIKEGINDWEVLTVDDDYEVIGGRLWIYVAGTYQVTYSCGYGTLPQDLRNDILTLVAWMYENRGKKMNNDPKAVISQYPNWDGLNYHQYRQIII